MNTSTPETPPLTDPLLTQRWRKRSLLAFLFSLAILAFFLSRLEVDLGAIVQAVRSADVRVLVLAFFVYYSLFPLRALRWRFLLETARAHDRDAHATPSILALARMIFLSWFANCVIPAKLGDAYRAYQLKQASGLSFSAAIGTVVAERLLDMAVLVILLLLATMNIGGSVIGESEFAGRVVAGGILLVAIGAVGIAGMWALRGRLHPRLPATLKARYLLFQESTLGSFRSILVVAPLSVMVWLGEASRLFLVAQSLDLGIPFPYAIFLSLANSLLTVVPFTPGGLGLVEAGIVGLLLLVGVDKEAAVAAALVDRSISYWSIVVIGLPVFLSRRGI